MNHFWVIFVTYNRGIYICIFIYKVSDILYFLVIFNCNAFSVLNAKHFEIWKNILWNWWVDCFIARSIKWCDILGPHSESIFPFMQYFFLSRKLCFLRSPCLLLIAESIIDSWLVIDRCGVFLENFFFLLNNIVNPT